MTEAFDVIVVGAGIHGAGVAQRAAAAGHRVLILEKTGIAAGTSSRSSKLIHGGLRYLETWQWRLVRESLHARSDLLRLAPELVQLQRFHVPVYARTRRRPWLLGTGLALYAALAGFDRGAGFGTVPRRLWSGLDGLETLGLQRVLWYHDAQTDDAALTRAVIASALSLGAELRMPAALTGVVRREDGIVVRYTDARGDHEVLARVLVNAAGPWASRIARLVDPHVVVPGVELVQGTHLLIAGTPPRGCYYVESPRDGRAVFILPFRGELMVGTTEVRLRREPERVAPTTAERHYLMEVLRRYFPSLATRIDSPAVSAFAGVRVLPVGSGHAFHRSRETHFTVDRLGHSCVVGIYGGKLTTFRPTAAHVLELCAPCLPARTRRGDVDTLRLAPA